MARENNPSQQGADIEFSLAAISSIVISTYCEPERCIAAAALLLLFFFLAEARHASTRCVTPFPNFYECIHDRTKRPNRPIDVAHKVMVTFALAELSYRESKTKIFDPETQRVVA
jgi:hypothetical protein